MRSRRLLCGAAGWAGFSLALGLLLALNSSRWTANAGAGAVPRAGSAPTPGPAPPFGRTAEAADTAAAARSATGRHAVPVALRLASTFTTWTGFGVTLGLLLALVAPLAFGMRPLVVLSGSMEPLLHVGDVTVVQRIAPHQARVGHVVTFKAPGSGRTTTHRLRAARRTASGRFAFTTKGDANNAIERWTLPADGQLSRAVYRVPLVGHALLAIATPLGWTLLVGLPLLLLAIQEIARIWRTTPQRDDAPVAS